MGKNKKSPFKKSLKKTLHNIHLWVGLILCAPIVALGITGSILTFEHEIEDYYTKNSLTITQGETRPIEEIITSAAVYAPQGVKISMLRMPDGSNSPAMVSFTKPQEGKGRPERVSVNIDPVSLEKIQMPEFALEGFFKFNNQLHTQLLLREYKGRSIVGWIGVAMLVMILSGIYLWWPKKGKLKKSLTIKKGATGYRFHRDLHQMTGMWGLLILLTVSFTGVYLAFPEDTGSMIRTVFGGEDLRSKMRGAKIESHGGQESSLNDVIQIAQDTVTDAKIAMIRFPDSAEKPYIVNLITEDYIRGEPMITVHVDQFQAKAVNIFDPRKYNTGETITMWQRAVHGAYGLNNFWKIVFFISGFMPLLFTITGVYMWWVKR